VSQAQITRIPSGVELPVRSILEKRPRPFTVGTLAAFTPQKDPRTWLQTVVRVCGEDPEIRFVWAGQGELVRDVEVGIQRAGLSDRVVLPGFVREVDHFWEGIDAFFLPSAFEALGTVFLDALARGIPVVGTRAGGIPETVRPDREGILRPVGDVEGLATALLRLQRAPGLARQMGEAGRERAQEFEISRVVDRIVDLYERLLRTRGGRMG
jgi:glycosyltransferase involved in cell wall biosynthesis